MKNIYILSIFEIYKKTSANIVLAKDGVNIVFENSVNNIRKIAFHISFFSNLEI